MEHSLACDFLLETVSASCLFFFIGSETCSNPTGRNSGREKHLGELNWRNNSALTANEFQGAFQGADAYL